MPVDGLMQAEADSLIELEKIRVDEKIWNYPARGEKNTIPLTSIDRREDFSLSMYSSRIDIAKGSYHNRARGIVPLVRLCFGDKPHTNPDGERFDSTHLHVYREGYQDKWAFPPPAERFPNLGDQWQTFHDFMRFCNIVEPPHVKRCLPL